MLSLLTIYYLAQGLHTYASPIPMIVGRSSSPCQDLGHCRTLWNIIWSCLVTIFSCTWVAIHPNIPRPILKRKRPRFQRWLGDPLVKFVSHRLPLLVCALLVPEYILAWAIRQRLMAGRMAKRHKDERWTTTHGFFVIMGGFHLFRRPQPDSKPLNPHEDDIPLNPLNPHEDDIPLHPLSDHNLKYGKFDFALPTEEEIQDKGKSDWLAKTLVLFQTTWFIMQCAARGFERLPVTKLEIVTLGYATMNFAIYLFWWNKPLNVDRPIRVFMKSPEGDTLGVVKSEVEAAATPGDNKRKRVLEWLGSWEGVQDQLEKILTFVAGDRDGTIDLHDEGRVPTFWSGEPHTEVIAAADTITVAVGVIFGAIHCIAWSFSFPSYEERIIWRVCSIAIVAVPAFIPALVMLWLQLFGDYRRPIIRHIAAAFVALGSLSYIIPRILTVALAFTCLRSLPPEAYKTVHWTTYSSRIVVTFLRFNKWSSFE